MHDRINDRARRVLFVQATDPSNYPPLIHAATLMADNGWEVTFLSLPIAGNLLTMPAHPRISVRALPARPTHVVRMMDYIRYCAVAARLAIFTRPHVVYASDIMGAGLGLFAAKLGQAALVYHEHDSPAPGVSKGVLSWLRKAAARNAKLVVFPNRDRADIMQAELGFRDSQLHIVWNLPRRSELPLLMPPAVPPLILYYHGNISSELLPVAVVEAVKKFEGRIRLHLVGYESPGARGYVSQILALGGMESGENLVDYMGEIPRDRLLAQAALGHIGLAVMPRNSGDINMRHMVGASNKAFDYMAAGLGLLVSDLPDWQEMFVVPGYARACDPASADSIAAALDWFLDHAEERQTMAARARAKIEAHWNYDTAFLSIIETLARA